MRDIYFLKFNFMLLEKAYTSFKVLCPDHYCRNPSFGLATKVKGLQGCEPRGSPGVTSETPGSVRECEGVSLHTPKVTPKLGEGVPVDF